MTAPMINNMTGVPRKSPCVIVVEIFIRCSRCSGVNCAIWSSAFGLSLTWFSLTWRMPILEFTTP